MQIKNNFLAWKNIELSRFICCILFIVIVLNFVKKQSTMAHRGQSRALLQPCTSVEYKSTLPRAGHCKTRPGYTIIRIILRVLAYPSSLRRFACHAVVTRRRMGE